MARLEITLDQIDSGWLVKVVNLTTYATTQHAISSLTEMQHIPWVHRNAVEARAKAEAEALAAK